MLQEFGMDPNIPGLEIVETVVDESLRYNPECPCKTRTCPQHGFCKLCVQHHAELSKLHERLGDGMPPKPQPKDGEYPMDHSRPLCQRMPNEALAKWREDYK